MAPLVDFPCLSQPQTKSHWIATIQKAHNLKKEWEEGRMQVREKHTVESTLPEHEPTAYLRHQETVAGDQAAQLHKSEVGGQKILAGA